MPNEAGRPIPKIVGRGKNRVRIPRPSHGYSLRSSVTTGGHSSPCSYCTHYRACQEDADNYNSQLRSQLLKTTVRALVVERWKRQREEKIKKLRGLLHDRANEIRENNLDLQAHFRDARIRRTELQHATTQLHSCQEEIADLHKKLEDETKKVRTFEEVAALKDNEVKEMQNNINTLTEQLSQVLAGLESNTVAMGDASDPESMSSRLVSIRGTMAQLANQQTEAEINKNEAVSDSQTLLSKLLSEVICGVCQDAFIDPVALPCGHVFCEFCIR